MANAIHVIVPYRRASTWVFDDPRMGLLPHEADETDRRQDTFASRTDRWLAEMREGIGPVEGEL